MRNLLRIYLTKSGFQVTEASNGHEAMKLIEQIPFDLILLDIMMPDMDGWEVCKQIRIIKQTPILMLARTETKDKIHGLNLGADDYLIKPFEPDELIARIFALLRRSTLSESTIILSKTKSSEKERQSKPNLAFKCPCHGVNLINLVTIYMGRLLVL